MAWPHPARESTAGAICLLLCFLLGASCSSRSPLEPGAVCDGRWEAVGLAAGRIDRIHCPFFLSGRAVWVLKPQGYDPRTHRYAVLYLNDGHTMFDGVNGGGIESWHVDRAVDSLVAAGRVESLLVVAIDNGGARREYEYTPFAYPYALSGGDGYLLAVTAILKPAIDRMYATRPDRAHTYMGGASLGGLISVYAGYRDDEVFGAVAGMSGSYSWSGDAFYSYIRSRGKPRLDRLYIDTGTVDDNTYSARELRDIALGQGFVPGVDLLYVEEEGATHENRAWAGRFPGMLEFIAPPAPGPVPLSRRLAIRYR